MKLNLILSLLYTCIDWLNQPKYDNKNTFRHSSKFEQLGSVPLNPPFLSRNAKLEAAMILQNLKIASYRFLMKLLSGGVQQQPKFFFIIAK